jgi:hypothetical protein
MGTASVCAVHSAATSPAPPGKRTPPSRRAPSSSPTSSAVQVVPRGIFVREDLALGMGYQTILVPRILRWNGPLRASTQRVEDPHPDAIERFHPLRGPAFPRVVSLVEWQFLIVSSHHGAMPANAPTRQRCGSTTDGNADRMRVPDVLDRRRGQIVHVLRSRRSRMQTGTCSSSAA